ncbi:MAG: hypothetical protein SF069_02385 [Phycisphaerae bacterium]|nr:hypothetical protein [Phycisphaerae bacterium]
MMNVLRLGCLVSLILLCACFAGDEPAVPPSVIEVIKKEAAQGESGWKFIGNIAADGAVYRRLRVVESIELGNSANSSSGYVTISAEPDSVVLTMEDRQNSPRSTLTVRLDKSGYTLVIGAGTEKPSIGIRRTEQGQVELFGDDVQRAIAGLLKEGKQRSP